MATFSTNQVRQVYVGKALGTVATGVAAGTIQVGADTAQSHLYFKYMSPGGPVRSDLINIANVISATATDADAMAYNLTRQKLSLDSAVNSGNPKSGQDYIVKLVFRNYVGLSDEHQYEKYGVVRATANMTAEQFYTVMLASLTKNFSREVTPLVTFALDGVQASAELVDNSGVTVTAKTLGTAGNSLRFVITAVNAGSSAVTVTTASGVTTISVALKGSDATIGGLKTVVGANTAANALVTIAGTNGTAVVVEDPAVALTGGSTTGIIFEEAEQDWHLGTMQTTNVNFTVQPTTINDGTSEVIWGTVTKLVSINKVENGKNIADLEYFAMGARGDQYRMIGWPNVVYTKYLVDPTLKYNVINLQYAYQGNAEDIQKSQKTIQLLVPKVGATNDVSNALANSIITAINNASGLTIATLAV